MKFKFLVVALVLSAVMFVGCSNNNDQESLRTQIEAMTERQTVLENKVENLEASHDIRTVVNTLFIETDNMNWDKLLTDVFTEEVYFDMTSVGGTAGVVTAQSIVDGWETGFSGIESVHHQSGNVQIEVSGNEATVFQYGTATQYAQTESGENTRTFIGTYEFGLIKENDQWKVNAFTFNLKILDGNVSFN